MGDIRPLHTLCQLATHQRLTINRRFKAIPDQLPVSWVALNLGRLLKLERDAVSVAQSARWQCEGL